MAPKETAEPIGPLAAQEACHEKVGPFIDGQVGLG